MIKKFVLTPGLLCFLLVIVIHSVKAQPFVEEIEAFKKHDSVAMPPQNAILFVGSSSLRMWSSINQDFPVHSIINRGFGGSLLPDVIRYADRIIFPYKAGQIVIYCGENDLAASDTVSAEFVFERFRELFNLIRKQQPEVPVAFVSIKPSPSRQHLLKKVVTTNDLVKDFLKKQTKTAYIDVFSAMLDEEGKPNPDLFVDDRLHMNKKGYALWIEIIGPHLIKN